MNNTNMEMLKNINIEFSDFPNSEHPRNHHPGKKHITSSLPQSLPCPPASLSNFYFLCPLPSITSMLACSTRV